MKFMESTLKRTWAVIDLDALPMATAPFRSLGCCRRMARIIWR